MKPTRLPQWAIAAVVITLVAAACGGGQDDVVNALSEQPAAQSTPGSETNTESASDASSAPSKAETSSPEQAQAETRPTEATPPEEPADPADNELPDVDVVDLKSGAEINLRTLAPADTPIVLWFWAPN